MMKGHRGVLKGWHQRTYGRCNFLNCSIQMIPVKHDSLVNWMTLVLSAMAGALSRRLAKQLDWREGTIRIGLK